MRVVMRTALIVFVSICVPASERANGAERTFRQGENNYIWATDTFVRGPTDGDMSFESSVELHVDQGSHPFFKQAAIRFARIVGDANCQIPPAAKNVKATLELYVTQGFEQTVSVYEILEPWNGNDTWNKWEHGIDHDGYEAAEVASHSHTKEEADQTLRFDISSIVAGWIKNKQTNHGVALICNGTGGGRFASSEEQQESRRPKLIVSFEE